MPRRTTYSRQDVIQAAFGLVEEQGLQQLSARTVARRLRSSTAPVYSNFATMDELSRAVVRQAKELLQEYATTPNTGRVFLDLGVGFVRFARDHRNLFRALFLESNAYQDVIAELHAFMLSVMDRDEKLDALSREQKGALLTRMAIITHGFAAQICVGLIEEADDDFIVNTLLDIGAGIVDAALTGAE